MRKVLFISPHADDAILSCGAYIAWLTSNGCEVTIATVFTSSGTDVSSEIQEHYNLRKADDERSAAILGAKTMHLNFIDAPHRNNAYHNFSTILFHHQLPAAELFLVKAIRSRLNDLITELQPEQVFFPLGVGGHIDHHIIFESSNRYEEINGYTLAYYEEQPYNLVPGWNMVRWQQLGADVQATSGIVPWPLPLDSLQLAFIRNYMYEGDDTIQSTIYYNKEMSALPGTAFLPIQWQLHGKHYNYTPLLTHASYFREKCKAISEYTTEWTALFGASIISIQETLAADLIKDTYMERCWTINDQL